MNVLTAKPTAGPYRFRARIHRAQLRQLGGFVLLLAAVAWSYEMLSFVPAPPRVASAPLAAAPQAATPDMSNQAPEPDPSANAIAFFDIAPT